MKDITIKPDASLKKAMLQIDETAENALLVVDADHVLLGTLTDGDIRRYILGGHELESDISTAFQTEPTFFFQDEYTLVQAQASLTSKKIDLIPILDRQHKVVDFITWESAFGDVPVAQKALPDVPVVIMAGGMGTRLEPFTKVLPKPLIPINEKPIINHIIDRFLEFGISDFHMLTGYKAGILKAYFDELAPEYSLRFTKENKPLGTAGGLKLLDSQLKNPFFLTNCDVILNVNYHDIYSMHMEKEYDLTMVVAVKDHNIPYGICELNSEGDLKQIIEKPEYSYLVNTGLYMISPELLSLIPSGEFFHITHLIERVIEGGGKVGVFPISGNAWLDVGEWEQYRDTIKVMETQV